VVWTAGNIVLGGRRKGYIVRGERETGKERTEKKVGAGKSLIDERYALSYITLETQTTEIRVVRRFETLEALDIIPISRCTHADRIPFANAVIVSILILSPYSVSTHHG